MKYIVWEKKSTKKFIIVAKAWGERDKEISFNMKWHHALNRDKHT